MRHFYKHNWKIFWKENTLQLTPQTLKENVFPIQRNITADKVCTNRRQTTEKKTQKNTNRPTEYSYDTNLQMKSNQTWQIVTKNSIKVLAYI